MDTTDKEFPRRTVLLGLTGALVGACGRAATRPAGAQVVADRRAGMPASTLTAGMAALAWRLYQVNAVPERNTVLSPLSIAVAFAMLRVGARGGTAAELDAAFAFPAHGRDAGFSALTRRIVTQHGPPPAPARTARPGQLPPDPVLCLANGVFTGKDVAPNPAFMATVRAQYQATVEQVDFATDGLRRINGWVSRQTAGRIDQLFADLDPDTILVLANCLYLKAAWANPFLESDTRPEAFTRANGSAVRVPTMHASTEPLFRYADGPGWQAVELPYTGRGLAMWVLLPAPGRPPGGLLTPAVLGAALRGAQARLVDLSLPRWDFASDYDLSQTLPRLGVRSVFSTGAGLAGICPGAYVSQAVHKARITVDENGTEAAAATGAAVAESLVVGRKVEMRVNRPFAFAIVHTPSRTPLFLGHVQDPLKTSTGPGAG